MASSISAGTTSSTALVATADTTGALALQSNNGVTGLTLNASQAIGVGSTPSFGTSGQVLISGGSSTSPTWGSALVSGTAVASTSGTSIDFTSIPSWVKRITVMFNAVSTSGSSFWLLRLGTSGTPETTGYDSTSLNIQGAGISPTTSTAGFVSYTNVAGYVDSGTMIVTNISGNTWVCSGLLGTSTSSTVQFTTSGTKTLAGVLNMVRITTVNGTDTFDAGSINILYE